MRISDWSSDVCSSDLSWLRRAEAEQTDEDVRFILLWIGFNAAYAGDVEASRVIAIPEGERGLFQAFFATLVGFDGKHRIYDMVWQRFPQEIRVLLANRYVFHPFWQHHNGASGYADRSEEHPSELQSLMRISYAVFC